MEQDKKRGYIGFCDTSVVPGEARARRFRGRSAKSLFLIAAQASSALLMAGAAHAQTAAASRANDDPEIVVTAQKRSEKLTEVPLAMSVIQAADLAKRGAASLADIAAYMPGVAISNGGAPGQNGVVIRGLATSYNNSFNAPLVVTYIDD